MRNLASPLSHSGHLLSLEDIIFYIIYKNGEKVKMKKQDRDCLCPVWFVLLPLPAAIAGTAHPAVLNYLRLSATFLLHAEFLCLSSV